MRGEFIGVWQDTFREIWDPLAGVEGAPDDLYCELFRAFSTAFKVQLTAAELANKVDDPLQGKTAFLAITAEDFLSEPALAAALEFTRDTLDDLLGPQLYDPYFNLLSAFIDKFSLRYNLIPPCFLCPTLPGLFASLIRDLRNVANTDPHLSELMTDFENAIQGLRTNPTEGHMKTCIQKQINLLEGMGAALPHITGNTLGQICDQAGTWPHAKIKEVIKNVYGFACDYRGIRHGGTAANAVRNLEMKDMVSISILLAGFTPYLSSTFNVEAVYGAAKAI